jgi:hypothetical protein
MKRIILLVTVAMVVVLMMAVAGPAMATIHPLSNAECANDSASDIANEQHPPGLSDPTSANFARPVVAVSGGNPFTAERPSPAFKTFGTSVADLDAYYCPAANK